MQRPCSSRAVSAFFRCWGGRANCTDAEKSELTTHCAMHRGEQYLLAVVIPLTVFIAVAEWLVGGLEKAAGLLLALPASFILLNLLPGLFRVRSLAWQWRCWLVLLILWGGWRHDAAGVVAVAAWFWLIAGMLNLAAAGVLGLRRVMRYEGYRGVRWRIALMIALHLAAFATGWIGGWLWLSASLMAVTAGILFSILNPSCQWLGPVETGAAPEEILITIDDGPDPHDTPRLLDLLDAYQTRAVFFVIGEKVLQHPGLAREILRRGHELGNHTQTHPQASFWALGPERTRKEIVACQDTIQAVTGFTPRWFRAPVGHRNPSTHPFAAVCGLQVMAWNRRGYDAVTADAQKVISRIVPAMRKGDIVLLHEATLVAAEVLEAVLAERLRLLSERPGSC